MRRRLLTETTTSILSLITVLTFLSHLKCFEEIQKLVILIDIRLGSYGLQTRSSTGEHREPRSGEKGYECGRDRPYEDDRVERTGRPYIYDPRVTRNDVVE